MGQFSLPILAMYTVSARWVPRMLTKDQKKTRLNISNYLLSLCEDDPEEFMLWVVNHDELGSVTLILRLGFILAPVLKVVSFRT